MRYLILILILIINFDIFSQDLKWNYIQNISILNSQSDDFAPSWNKFEQKLYFNSNRDSYSKFYISSLINENFSIPSKVEGDINLHKNNQAYICFESPIKAYISTFKMYDGKPYLNIFQTYKKRQTWLSILEVDSLQMKHFCGQATISPDTKTMIFVTDANSLYGDTDLWAAYKQDNETWGNLIKLTNLCSPGNEITPFLASDDTLYFASDGQEGEGGFDIFMSVKINGFWQDPFPIKEINTEFNESDFCVLPSGNEAIFSSDRPGGLGGLDLYYTKKQVIHPQYITPHFQYQIATQVPVIKILASGFKRYDLINNNFVYNKELFEQNQTNIPKEFEYLYSFYLNQFEKISYKISHNNIKLNCKIFSNKNFNNDIANSIMSKLNINSNQIQFTYEKLPEILKNKFGDDFVYFSLSTDKPEIFGFDNYFEADSIEIQPPILQGNLLVQPQNLVKNLKFYILNFDNKEKLIFESEQNPVEFIIDLRPFDKFLLISDSLNFKIENIDTSGKNHQHFESLFIIHSITTKTITQSNDKNFITLNYNLIENEELLINSIDEIFRELYNDYNNFEITVNSNINDKYLDEKIKSSLNNLNGKNKKIIFKKDKINMELPFEFNQTLITITIYFN